MGEMQVVGSFGGGRLGPLPGLLTGTGTAGGAAPQERALGDHGPDASPTHLSGFEPTFLGEQEAGGWPKDAPACPGHPRPGTISSNPDVLVIKPTPHVFKACRSQTQLPLSFLSRPPGV